MNKSVSDVKELVWFSTETHWSARGIDGDYEIDKIKKGMQYVIKLHTDVATLTLLTIDFLDSPEKAREVANTHNSHRVLSWLK